jgi:succinate dehydrogenase / fumarate reductase flavoprotein subunit
LGNYLATQKPGSRPGTDAPAFVQAEEEVKRQMRRFLETKGSRTVYSFHKELGKLMWEYVGMGRNKQGLETVLQKIPALREEFWKNLNVPGEGCELNQALERAGRTADFLELAELLARDALTREESCGGHFREEYQYEDGEAKRDDEKFAHVAAWGYQSSNGVLSWERHVEPLVYEEVKMTTRSYK